MQNRVLCFVAVLLLVFTFANGCSSEKSANDSPLSLIQNGKVKEGALALSKLGDDEGWELLGSLSDDMRDSVFRELITQALSHYASAELRECESLLSWVEEHSGGDYEALKLAQAELYLLKGKTKECTELLIELAGIGESIDVSSCAQWSQPLKDFYAANIMKNKIGLNPLVDNLGVREDIYIDDVVSAPKASLTSGTGNGQVISSAVVSSKKRPRAIRYPFSGDRQSVKKLSFITENSYRGMGTKELIAIAGKPSRIIPSSLPTDGLWKMVERTERWDYVDDNGTTGLAVIVLNGVVKSIGRYERKLK